MFQLKRAKFHAKSAKIFRKERKDFFVKGAEVEVEDEDGTSILPSSGQAELSVTRFKQ